MSRAIGSHISAIKRHAASQIIVFLQVRSERMRRAGVELRKAKMPQPRFTTLHPQGSYNETKDVVDRDGPPRASGGRGRHAVPGQMVQNPEGLPVELQGNCCRRGPDDLPRHRLKVVNESFPTMLPRTGGGESELGAASLGTTPR